MKVGDKYIIEIEEVIRRNGAPQIARIKGFNALVFDKYGLEKLEPYDGGEKVYRKGYVDVKNAVQKQDAEIKVGDEVVIDDKGRKAVVSRALDNGLYNIVFYNGDTNCVDRCFISKTGRHFDAIAEVLAELRGKE